MKKAAIISLYYKNHNFGGQLQAFALQKKISEIGYDCEQLCIDIKYRSHVYCLLREIKHSSIKTIFPLFVKLIKYLVKWFVLYSEYKKLKFRKSAFELFSKKVSHSSNVYSIDDIENANNEYNCYIVGSDCIWSKDLNEKITCLEFVTSTNKKISFSPSLGCSSIPDGWADRYLDGIKTFDAISVREPSIAKELQQLIPNKEINVTVDPTLLFTAEEWESFLPDTKGKEKYALIYILSEDEKQCRTAERWVHSIGLKSFVFPHIHNILFYWQRDYGDIRNFTSGPLEFVSLIKNAEVIITDSFHATIFSSLFHKPFYALKRDTQKEFVGRVENFLDDTGLSNQMVSTEELLKVSSIPDIDYSVFDITIAEKREKSIKYLKDNLS